MLKIVILSTTALAATISAIPAFAQDAAQDPPDQTDPVKPDPRDSAAIVVRRTVAKIERTDIIITATGAAQHPEDTGQSVTLITRAAIEQRQTVAVSDLLATTPGVTVTRNGGLGTLTSVRIRGAEGDQTLTLIDGVRVNDPSSPGGGFDFANLLAGSVERIEILRGPNSVPWGSQAIGGVINVVTGMPDRGFSARGNVEYGSFDTVFANAGGAGASGILKGSLNAGYLRSGGISAASSGTERDGYRQYGATGRVEVALTDNLKLDLRGYFADSRAEIDGFAFVAPFLPVDDAEYSKTQELYGYAALKLDLADGAFKNRIAFSIADINRDNFDPSFQTTPIFFARGRSERYTYQGDWQMVRQLRLVGGVEHEDTRFADGTVNPTRGVTSVYGQAIVTPVEQFNVTGGVRYDHDSAYGDHVSWSANARWNLTPSTSISGSYAEGFKAPTLYQLYGPFGLGNVNLQPETARGYDVTINQSLARKRINASLTWFHRDTTNQIDFDLGTFTYNNIARTRGQGIEVALNLRPTDRLTLYASYSFIDTQNRARADANFGKDLARRPHQSFSASIDWRTTFKLGLGATVLMVSDSFDDARNLNRLDGYAILGVRADYPITKRISVYGRVDNVFDDKYTIVRGYGTPGRAAYGGIRVKFD